MKINLTLTPQKAAKKDHAVFELRGQKIPRDRCRGIRRRARRLFTREGK